VTSSTLKVFDPLEKSLAADPMTQLTRTFVYFLQNTFRDFPEGCGMKWSPEEENTEMMITAEKPRLEAIEKLPHIVCILGAAQWSNVSLDQFQRSNAHTGARTHTDLMPMSVSYHCQAKEGLHARRIAWNASLYTNTFRRVIQRYGKLHHVAPSHQISAESPASAYVGQLTNEELVSVTVTVPFYWQPQWTITDIAAEKLRKITSTMGIRDRKLSPPMIKGKPAWKVTLVDIDNQTPELVQTVEVE